MQDEKNTPEESNKNNSPNKEAETQKSDKEQPKPAELPKQQEPEKPVSGTFESEPIHPGPNLRQADQAADKQNRPDTKQPGSSGLMVLQWLTYAFWGWALTALSSLVAAVTIFYIADGDTAGFTPYAIAALLVLLPIAYVSDRFYAKKEPQHKTGGALAIMLIHAVIFALAALGSFVTAVFVMVSMMTDYGDTSERMTIIISAIVIALLSGLAFVRILNTEKFAVVTKYFRLIMVGVAGLIVILAFAGPVIKESRLKNDKLIERELPSLSSAINKFAKDNDKLPPSLDVLDLEEQEKLLVDKSLVDYIPNSNEQASQSSTGELSSSLNDALKKQGSSTIYTTSSSRPSYYYQLCVTYQEESDRYKESRGDYDEVLHDGGYDTYISTYRHPKGRVCYKVKTTDYNY